MGFDDYTTPDLDYIERRLDAVIGCVERLPTERELFAAMAMQGLVSDFGTLRMVIRETGEDDNEIAKAVAGMSVTFADALLAELSKKEEKSK